MIVAISAVSESGDHYLWCETGSADEIVESLKALEDFAYLGQVSVVPLQTSEGVSAMMLKNKIIVAIDDAQAEL